MDAELVFGDFARTIAETYYALCAAGLLLISMNQIDSTENSSSLFTPGTTSKRLLPWLVAVAFFMESLDTTILNTAVPTIAAALRVVPLSMKSVLASYTLSLAVFIPISGWMADRFGTRRVFATAIGLFTLGSFLCGVSTNIHELVACRILQGCGGAMMVPVGRLTMVRTFAKSELIRAMSFVAIPGLIGPMLGPIAGGLIVGYFHWRVIFFVNIPIGLLGLIMVYLHLPDYREEHTNPLDITGLVLFGSGIALLSYVLEVFGEHTLNSRAVLGLLALSLALLAGYGFHATRAAFPLLRLALFRIRTFRASVTGSFVTRLGIGGIPFLFPLLYQVGLGFTPIQSGLLMMPQAIAAMSLKLAMPKILRKFGYRVVLISNTVIIGMMILLFATIGVGTQVWLIVIQLFCYGFFTSLQYTSMNTLVYADVTEEQSSSASTIASTMQQMSISFGVASASLVTAFFIPDRFHSNASEIIHGIHHAFLVLGALTILSTIVFRELKNTDGDSVSQRGEMHSV
jgi:EmrB/QacA subfamily drug resistance transporter